MFMDIISSGTSKFIIDALGWTGLILLFPATWFQIIKNYKRKSTQGVSLMMFLSLFTGLCLFFIVSLFQQTPLPVIVQFAMGGLGNGIVLLQMAVYKNGR
ncbi:MAG: hypothetical protein A3B96_00465 [Candidatus Spechtbacteria bacterium RIFCSPHIGHO2_02_FULL_43_15b]|uniref:Lipid A biosynthesis N-terminal domain-containing protein n=1 Tax=Candidatus Spechtbacteria bacterium RIFCSPHIGHO2_01_FULL_43_30 TaxID=1802158 RepID=A0A1G2H511_9BACT|nr:MAG: hypothetical protein A2827_03015 [Candidatus Spechtbacteria bacterium RIFCSPHIGHO2_01_FULL_43_30]OGZ59344.1 MAG: hypothetical protein A3B96_00465 [Candidatus Spechtbacteria bacterium RIFCSPHIGHO2_02_FULL_43_15b]